MASTFFTSTRGCIYVQEMPGGGRGFYELEPGFSAGSNIYINGSDLSIGDIVTPVTTLAREKILYSFGKDWGRSDVSGMVLLGEAADGGANLGELIAFFQSNRVDTLQDSVKLSVPGDKGYEIFLHRLTLGTPDPETHIQPFILSTTVLE